MKILYFDTYSLFYSQRYIDSDREVSAIYEQWKCDSGYGLLSQVKPDFLSIEKLRNASISSGLILYPLGTRYGRQVFIDNSFFNERELAPEVPLSLRLGDSDPLRRMVAHAHKLNATWYVCGDCEKSDLLRLYPDRYLSSALGQGVTDELVAKIQALKFK